MNTECLEVMMLRPCVYFLLVLVLQDIYEILVLWSCRDYAQSMYVIVAYFFIQKEDEIILLSLIVSLKLFLVSGRISFNCISKQ